MKSRTKYISDDGLEFDNEYDCIKHEIEYKKAVKGAESLRLEQYNYVFPISIDGLAVESNYFTWYEIKNEDDYYALVKACGEDNIKKPDNYPEIICVETCGEEYMGETWGYLLSELIRQTEEYWRKFGYKIKIEKVYMGDDLCIE
jgi:hypothetical protein